ncbi:MAG: LOG family protein [Phycisphaeraceae bacterium]|nr:LOG family protein [Phycisphaeraceae bacterium]
MPSSHEPNRPELDPVNPSLIDPDKGTIAPAESVTHKRADDPAILAALDGLVVQVGGKVDSSHGRYVKDLLVNALKLIPDGRSTGELKLMTGAVKELRYAFRIFGEYPEPHKVTIFGSARTPKDHPDYVLAVEFSRLMGERGWMSITGAGGGIMEAGLAGPGREKSFGVGIRLPFEQTTNQVIAGDSKLMVFRYFFTRKLMFISQAEAVALFPGGFGTMDEAFETLTLIQTGKAAMLPVVMLQGEGVTYWNQFDRFIREDLLARGWVGEDDLSLYKLCATAKEAADYIEGFYRVYHSSRYIKDDLVIRLKRALSDADVAGLNKRFASLIKPGGLAMHMRGPFPVEDDHLGLPRLVFTHTRHAYGKVRQLIDAINACGG